MIWLVAAFLLAPFIVALIVAAVETAFDWRRACNKLVALWDGENPCKNKARTKVWFP